MPLTGICSADLRPVFSSEGFPGAFAHQHVEQENRFLTKMFHNPLGYLVALALRTLPATMRGEHVAGPKVGFSWKGNAVDFPSVVQNIQKILKG